MYTKTSILGEGTYGKVYEVSDLLNRRKSALKRLLIDPSTKGDFILSLREIDMMTRLAHPHVMPVSDVLFSLPASITRSPLPKMMDDLISLVMPKADTTLDLFKGNGTQKKGLIWQLLAGLQHIHRHNVIHRDLKPQNLLLFNSLLRIGDFGLAIPYAPSEPRTPQMMTIWYRAPEILLNHDYDTRADIWSCGCILFELMSGRPLFSEDNEAGMVNSIYSLLTEGEEVTIPFTRLKRKKRAYVSGYGLVGIEDILHREMALTMSQIVEFEWCEKGSYRQFLSLLARMLSLDPTTRPSCDQLLKDRFFDPYRPQLALVSYPKATAHCLSFHPARSIAIGLIDQQRYPIQYRVKFLAVDLMDRVLALRGEQLEDNLPLIRKYTIACLYVAEKYLLTDRCCSFNDLTSDSEEDFDDYPATERELVTEVLQFRIYRATLYDYLPANATPREISRIYLLFRKALPLTGIRLDVLYRVYEYAVRRYYEAEGGEGKVKV